MARQTSMQVTQATDRQLEELQERGFGTNTDIIRMAVDRMHAQELSWGNRAAMREIESIVGEKLTRAVMEKNRLEIDMLSLAITPIKDSDTEVHIDQVGRVTKPHNEALRFSLDKAKSIVLGMLMGEWRKMGIDARGALERLRSEKPPLRELVGDRLDEVGDLRPQDLDRLQDAIEIRRNAILARRLEKRGIPTRTRKEFDSGGTYHFSCILVYDPAGELPGEWADREEARRLIDTVRNLAPAEAFRRWRRKVSPLARERYTRSDALQDVQDERAEADQMYRDGEIDAEMLRIMHRDARDYLDLAEDDA